MLQCNNTTVLYSDQILDSVGNDTMLVHVKILHCSSKG